MVVIVTKMISIKVREETYRRLNELAGKLRAELKRPVSIDEVINILLGRARRRVSEFAGAWEMDDEEAEEILKAIRSVRARWRLQK